LRVQPVILSGKIVRLEPLAEGHVPDLAEVGLEESIWHYMRYGPMRTRADLHTWVLDLLRLQQAGTDLPFAVIYQVSGKAIGATRYMDIQPENLSLEIGGTWYGLAYQRTAVNTESKYLLLRHAFELLGCNRVQLKTDSRNERSQKAIERLGATREGILREHMILPDGTARSSVYYSILAAEWPRVKQRLEELLEAAYR